MGFNLIEPAVLVIRDEDFGILRERGIKYGRRT